MTEKQVLGLRLGLALATLGLLPLSLSYVA